MNEQVLEVIIKLLAIIANIDESAGDKRGIIEKFLRSHVNPFEARKSLYLFDEYTAFVHDAGLKDAYEVAAGLNKELSKRQKTVILLHLVEMVLADQEVTEVEQSFMHTVYSALNIREDSYQDILEFLSTNDATDMRSANILLINDRKNTALYRVKHRFHDKLDSTLAILHLPETDLYFLRLMLPSKDIYLNGEQINWEYVYPLAMGSLVKGSEIKPIYYSEIVSHFLKQEDGHQIAFEAKDISYFFKSGDVGLQHIHVAEESGTLVALMGASGSGKSTLLNVLNGNLRPSEGTVKINGIDIYRDREQVKGVIGYVPQDDLLIEDLSVYQNLFYAARLCFGKANDAQLDKLVKKTLLDLGLYEARDLRVGNALDKTISGGQRKRLNIGLELLRQPSILFVDEPTSGLSSRDSENIIDLLRGLSLMGKLIFVVIHQPSSDIFKMFDKLVILDVGGYQIYYGNPLESLMYFRSAINHVDRDEESACTACGNVNVEEVFKIIEGKIVDEYGNETGYRKVKPEQWKAHFEAEFVPPTTKNVSSYPPNSLDIPGHWQQICTFITRDILAKLQNKQYILINTIQAPLLAMLLAAVVRFHQVDELTGSGGYIFSDNKNIPAYVFMSIIVALFMGLTISAEEIIRDARILKREAFLELSRMSYLLSKVIILFGISALQTFMYVAVGHLILQIDDMAMSYWLVLFSCSCFANVLGLNISDTFKSVITIYVLIPLLLIPQLILGGIVVKFDDINPVFNSRNGSVPLIAEFIAARWAFEALMVTQFKDNAFEKNFYEYDRIKATSDYKRIYYLPTLRSKLDRAYEQEDIAVKREILKLLRNELEKQHEETPHIPFKEWSRLVPLRFNQATLDSAQAYIDRLDTHYNQAYRKADRLKDRLITQIIEEKGNAYFQELLQQHRNESVAQLVTNTAIERRIVEYQDRLIQKVFPIYFDPPSSRAEISFNAHFFAPYKHLFHRLVSTFWFNLIIIWSMTAALYFAVHFRVFKQLIEYRLPYGIYPKGNNQGKRMR